jgi:phospholipase C
MRHRKLSRWSALVAAAAVLLLIGGPAASQQAQSRVPIDTLVVVMQEDRTFNNYFGTYPGANGWPEGFEMPRDPDDSSAGSVAPHKLTETRTISLPHSEKAMLGAYNDGAMDSFVAAAEEYGAPDGALAMGYYDYNDIPFYWQLADEFVLTDNWFSSVMGPSFPNHLYLFAGTRYAKSATDESGNPLRYDSIPADGMELDTIFDRLEEAGVSWKVYIQGYRPDVTYQNAEARAGLHPQASQLIWVPLVGIPRFVNDPVLNSKLVPLAEYFQDARDGTLPNVSFITPSGLSEHPPGDLTLGHFFATDLLEALMLSPHWESSAYVLTWDEWGGFADHVAPPQVDADGYGMRVPGLIASPYAKRGFVDSTLYDHTSVLATIGDWWGLAPLAERDANANAFENAFDFTQEPRDPLVLSVDYNPPIPEIDPAEQVARVTSAYNRMLLFFAAAFAVGVAAILLQRRRLA